MTRERAEEGAATARGAGFEAPEPANRYHLYRIILRDSSLIAARENAAKQPSPGGRREARPALWRDIQ